MKINPIHYLILMIFVSVFLFLGLGNLFTTATPMTDFLLTVLVTHLVMTKLIELAK
ncbi:hypothetical protein JOC85_001833 [Bacillus mesophilus]|uniref:Uncharacterized protein n=1 Tax=Bacillus mesophilus TaxID=1808955 RepID=A0A6M0Q583_9BACI|nr:hypothetical protein [Bacillus mesophilus]MBM7661061.1 hypothetical protein [Bacillus mesophilus]NEY71404.1 hypothetical protein [Bacillus mesophilus]